MPAAKVAEWIADPDASASLGLRSGMTQAGGAALAEGDSLKTGSRPHSCVIPEGRPRGARPHPIFASSRMSVAASRAVSGDSVSSVTARADGTSRSTASRPSSVSDTTMRRRSSS